MLKGFRQFIMRGNVIELAVGIVIGVAFGTVISSFVKNLITPLLAIPGKTDFASLTFTIHGSTFHYGVFLNDLISFVAIAAAVYFVVVLPLNRMAERRARGAAPDKKACPECLGEIPFNASKCMFCGTQQLAVVEQPATTS